MSKIVIGFDGSSESRDALFLGNSIAHSTGADLIVATAAGSPADLPSAATDRFVTAFDQARGELPHRDFAMRELRDVSAAAGLKDVAVQEEAEMIVIGSTHRGKLGRVVPGSVGERLLSGASCAVAVAPRGYARTEHFGLGLIGVAFDGSYEAEVALQRATTLARLLDSKLRVITIVPSIDSAGDGTLGTLLQDKGHEVRDRALAELPPWLDVESVLEEGDPALALARHGVDLDLLVIGSRGYGPLRRTLLGGVSADVMRTAPCPVLVVPRTAAAIPDEALVEVENGDGAP